MVKSLMIEIDDSLHHSLKVKAAKKKVTLKDLILPSLEKLVEK